jgi:hypothetical protein
MCFEVVYPREKPTSGAVVSFRILRSNFLSASLRPALRLLDIRN